MILQYILQNPVVKAIAIALLIIYCITLYTVKLDSIPTSVHGDEGETALQALDILHGKTDIFGVGWFDLPLLSFVPHALGMRLFGENIIGDRVGSVVFGLFTLPIFFLFIRQLFSFRIAAVATILLGTSHLWIALSRLGITYTQASFLMICTLYFLFKAFKARSIKNFIIAGAFLGLSFYSYYAIRILPIVIIPSIVFYIFNKKLILKNISHIILFLIAAFIVFLPQGIFFVKHPESFSSRTKTVFIFSESGKQWTNYNKTIHEILFEQTKKTFNIFAGDNSTQYGYKGALFDYLTLFFLMLGLLYSIIRFSSVSVFLFVWLSLAVAGQILTTIPTPIFLPRFVIGLPILYIFVALGIDVSIKFLIRKNLQLLSYTVIVITLAFIIRFNLLTYFSYYPKQIVGDPNARAGTKIAQYINSLPLSYTTYFLTHPSYGPGNGTIRFVSSNKNIINIENPFDYKIAYNSNVLGAEIGSNRTYIIYPQYAYKFRELQIIYPNSEIEEFKDIDGHIQFYVLKTKNL